jgi:hypothetical protein
MAIDEIAASKIRRRAGNQSTLVLDSDASFDFTAGQLKVDGANVGAGGGLTGWYDVTEAPYLATGDGTTDDTAAIQEAMDACAAAGGGVVYFPPGTYLCSATINIDSDVTMQGVGEPSLLTQADNSQCRFIENEGSTEGSITNATIRDLAIDGNQANQALNAGSAIRLRGDDIRILNCNVRNGSIHNIQFGTSSNVLVEGCICSGPGQSNYAYEDVTTVIHRGNSGETSDVSDTKFGTCTNVTCVGNVCMNGGTGGYYCDTSTDVIIAGNVSVNQSNGVRLLETDRVAITGNTINGSTEDGIALLNDCNHVIISGNVIRNSGTSAANTFDGINVDNTTTACTDVIITGNIITDSGSTMRYGIATENDSDDVSVIANQIEGAVTGNASLVSNHSILAYSSIQAFTSGAPQLRVQRHISSSTAPPAIYLQKTKSDLPDGHGLVSSTDQHGTIEFQASDGTTFRRSASIIARSDGTPASGDMPGRLEFSTTADGGTTTTAHVTIGNDGGIAVVDGITAPATRAGWATIYVDGTSGDLSVKFGDGTVKVIVADT